MAKKIVVVGGVATGAKTASRLRRLDPEAEITVLEQGQYLSYGACGLPYFISDLVKDHKTLMATPIGVVRDAPFFSAVKGFTALPGHRVDAIERERKVVTAVDTQTGAQREFPYDKLVLATGGKPVIPPLEGADLKNVLQLSTIEDGLAIKQLLDQKTIRNAVVVGAGLIGLEMVEALKVRGVQVTVVELLDWVLPALVDKELGLLVGAYLCGEGITVRTSEKVLRFEGDEHGAVARVITSKAEIPADLVLLSIGVRPNVELAQKAGLKIGTTGAIQVNEFLQTSDPNIYAGGDCVENVHRMSGKKVYTPMGSAANKHGRIIADHIMGDANAFPGVLGTAVCKVLGWNVGRTGLSEREAKTLGYDAESIICSGDDRSHFYPGVGRLIIKLVAEKEAGRLLGAQIVGPGDVAKRVEIMVSALTLGTTVRELASFDLAYAPPFSSAMDAIITAANVMQNKMKGLGKSISPLIVKERLDRGDDFVFLDVRSPQEYEAVRIDHPNVVLVPLGKLRQDAGKLPMDKEIIAFCAISLRGYEAQRILEGKGFSNVKFMEGGIAAWPFEKVMNS
nr:FAD-dependent oxidoreductase [Deltaproteobacteria bacterium]